MNYNLKISVKHVVIVLVLFLYRVFVFMMLWEWIITVIFELPKLNLIKAIGILWVTDFIFPSNGSKKYLWENPPSMKESAKKYLNALIGLTISLIIGWIISFGI